VKLYNGHETKDWGKPCEPMEVFECLVIERVVTLREFQCFQYCSRCVLSESTYLTRYVRVKLIRVDFTDNNIIYLFPLHEAAGAYQ
jgi:hypothetical protein